MAPCWERSQWDSLALRRGAIGFPRSRRGEQIFSAGIEHTEPEPSRSYRHPPEKFVLNSETQRLACPQRLQRWASPEAPGSTKSFRSALNTQSPNPYKASASHPKSLS